MSSHELRSRIFLLGSLKLCIFVAPLAAGAFFLWISRKRSSAVQEKQENTLYKIPGGVSRLRKDVSIAEWNEDTGFAQVLPLHRKGKLWNTTGIIRKGNLLCHLEEAVFLVERGSLILMHRGKPMQLQRVLELLTSERYGCTLDAYQVYVYFKSLGYVMARHGINWTDKTTANSSRDVPDELVGRTVNQQQQLNLTFDVHSPNSRFKKTAPGPPSFSICVCRTAPTRQQVNSLQQQSRAPVKFATVDGPHVGVFSFETVELPCLL